MHRHKNAVVVMVVSCIFYRYKERTAVVFVLLCLLDGTEK